VAHTLALLGQGELAAAARATDEALVRCWTAPGQAADLLVLLASACAGRGAHQAACEAQAAAAELDPRGDRFHQLGVLRVASGDHEGAACAFAAGADLGHVDSMLRVGAGQWQAGARGDALRTLLRGVAAAPDDVRPRAVLASALAACAEAGLDVRAARAALGV
jgi:hypothetical protein